MAATEQRQIRAFEAADVPELLQMMRGLAVFEGYFEEFCVTAEDLVKRGLSAQPDFYAWVCAEPGAQLLSGMAVTYIIPWTYDLKPTLVMKELFVKPEYRGSGVGTLLLQQVIKQAKQLQAPRIKWTVLHDNVTAAHFYRSMGADHDHIWHNWGIELAD